MKLGDFLFFRSLLKISELYCRGNTLYLTVLCEPAGQHKRVKFFTMCQNAGYPNCQLPLLTHRMGCHYMNVLLYKNSFFQIWNQEE